LWRECEPAWLTLRKTASGLAAAIALKKKDGHRLEGDFSTHLSCPDVDHPSRLWPQLQTIPKPTAGQEKRSRTSRALGGL